MSLHNVIAIDGPTGSGKSTVSKLVAPLVGLRYLDTGAMYRAIGFAAYEKGVALDDTDGLVALVASVSIEFADGEIIVNGVKATQLIREEKISQAASKVATNPEVREYLVERQRLWVQKNGGGVLDGRDIASVVCPDAIVKVFLTADVEERAKRRAVEQSSDHSETRSELVQRDDRDSQRKASPLVAVEGATIIDTTHLSIDQVVEQVVELYTQAASQL